MTAPALAVGSREWLNYYRLTVPGTPQPELREYLAGRLDDRDIDRAVVMWNMLMRGIRYHGGHVTAGNILNGGLKHHKIPPVPEWRREWLDPLKSAPVWVFRSWATPGAVDWDALTGPRHLASYDVNGMFLSAAACDLGSGAPELGTREDASVLKLPGWVLVEAMDPVPAWLGDRWRDEPMWMPTALVELLVERDVLPLWSRSLIWTETRRWLDPHVQLFRNARKKLLAIGGGSTPALDPAAGELLAIVKEIYTRAFGGRVRPKNIASNEDEAAVNHGWGRTLAAVAQARMLRHVTAVRPHRLAGIYHDAAWFLPPATKEVPLETSTQLGKFKAAGRLPWTDDLATLYAGGHLKAIARMLKGGGTSDDDTDD